MNEKIYDWKRFWCPRDGNINPHDGGYIVDPEEESGSSLNPDTKTYSYIARVPCLALLGEPGIGKSRAIQEAIESAKQAGRICLNKNLREFSSETRFVNQIFESNIYQEWLAGDHILEILLDSLDECLIRINTVGNIIIEQLREAPVERLHLRIACRTAEWPSTLESTLINYYGQEQFAAYELVPLRRRDVRTAAESEGVNADHFFQEVDRVRAQSLAIKPVTLRFLLKTYNQNQRLPNTEAELYQQGCRLLCEESQERRDSRVPLTYDADQRLSVAKRIAAITVFGNKFAVWTGPDEGDIPSEDVTVADLAIGKERTNERDFDVDRVAVEETLDTGLFSSRGLHRMGWAHQTYAEFLAAAYLKAHKITSQQILGLVTDNVAGQVQVIPQLQEVTARLAVTDRQIFETLLANDPTVLLRSDFATADDPQKQSLVQALLELSEKGELNIHRHWGEYSGRLRHLNHPDLADQLRPYLVDSQKNYDSRLLAVEIAKACSVAALTDKLAVIAFDRSSDENLRVKAIVGLGASADDTTKSRLIEILDESPENENDRVRLAVLEVLWPKYMTAEQLFDRIVVSHPINHITRYSIFISQGIMEHLAPAHLPAALRWVIRQEWSRFNLDLTYQYQDLLDGILAAAWEHIDEQEVLPLLAQAVCRRLVIDHGELFGYQRNKDKPFLDDIEKRRRLLLEIVSFIQKADIESFYLRHTGLTQPDDLPWVIEQLESEKDPERVNIWSSMVRDCYQINNTRHTDLIMERAQEGTRLREAFSWIFQTIYLNSPEAQAGREREERHRALRAGSEARPKLDPPPAELVQILLNRCETGEPCLWWHLARELSLTPESRNYEKKLEPDITTFFGWETADEPTKIRIIQTAKEFILHCHDERERWNNEDRTFYCPANGGYRALRLVNSVDPSFVHFLNPKIWANWVFALMKYPWSPGREEEENHLQPLLALAYSKSPGAFVDAMEAVFRREAAESQHLSVIDRVKPLLDPRISERLLALVNDPTLNLVSRGQILSFLIENDEQSAIEHALNLISQPLPPEEEERNFVIAAGEALGYVVTPEQWNVLWRVIQDQADFGKSLVNRWASHKHQVSAHLTDMQLADLYLCTVRQYPYHEDHQPLGNWRDQYLLGVLKHRGTFSACEAIEKVQNALPEAPWLRYTLLDALTLARTKNWQPLKPREILELVRKRETRIVGNCHQLLDVVIESLERLETEFHGENPTIEQVWDYQRKNRNYTPIDEPRLSSYVANFLKRDIQSRGIVINREVEIRPPRQGQSGQSTDIHIVAVKQNLNGITDNITCIVETKGCWNQDLKTAIKTQLVNRYLHDNQCRCGLYLVGWFMCDAWDGQDSRKKRVHFKTIEDARQYFKDQAASLSKNDPHINAYVLDARLAR